jgi:hypothetical protein
MKTLGLLIALVMATAGCTDDGAEAGPKCDLASNFVDEVTGECLPHVEPSILTSNVPAQLQQYARATVNWNLDPGTRGNGGEVVHSMDSRIVVSMEGRILDNTTGPDDWGTLITRQQHKNLPDNFTAILSWDEPGMLYVKGYMLIDAKNVWTEIGTIEITGVTASGNRTEVSISAGQPALSEAETTVFVGDGIRFVNDHEVLEYTLAFTGSACPSGGTIAAGASLDQDFLVPASCPYTLTSQATATGVGDLSGRATVIPPA